MCSKWKGGGGGGGDFLEFQVQMCPKDSKYHSFKNI
jgi:hypothetical protein